MFTLLSLERLINKPNMVDLANKLRKRCKRNNNVKGVVFYTKYLSTIKEFKELGKLERQVSPPIEAYRTERNKIKFSKISYGLLFE